MDDTTLRAVFTLDGKTQQFTPAGHNLGFDKAEALGTRLKKKGLRVSTVVQPGRHKGHGYKNCEPCKTAAKNFSEEETAAGETSAAEPAQESPTSAR
jgi:hypothetical protein